MEVFAVNRKIVIIILYFTTLIFIILLLFYRKDFLRIFKESESLNYHKDISYIQVFDNCKFINSGDSTEVIIDDSEDIKKLLKFLNSLELVKEEGPRKYNYNDEYLYINIVLKNSIGNFDEAFFFIDNYLIVYNEERKSEYIEYYIKDSNYNYKDKTSKVYNFLHDMVNKKQEDISN